MRHATAAPPPEDQVTSNISQSLPYSSETEAERAAAVAAATAANAGLDATIASEALPPDTEDSWWSLSRHGGCGGTLHVAGLCARYGTRSTWSATAAGKTALR